MIAESTTAVLPGRGAATPQTILVLDPDEDCRLIFATALRHQGYRVLEAAEDSGGLLLAQLEKPDLAIIEFAGRPRDPRELATAMRAGVTTNRPLLLAVSAWAFPEDRHAALANGFDAFYAKPIHLAHLLEEVRRWLATPTAAEGKL